MSLDSNNLIVRLFQQLGDAALPVLLSLMYRIPEDTKREFLVRSLNAYSPVLRDKLNEEFLKDKWGQCLQIGTIFVARQNNICLNIGRIKVDYQALLNNGQVTDVIHKRFGRFSKVVLMEKMHAKNPHFCVDFFALYMCYPVNSTNNIETFTKTGSVISK